MTKHDLIAKLSEFQNITKKQAEEVVRLFFDEMATALAKDDRVEIRGLCSLHVKEYRSYTGRNPRSGGRVTVPGKKLPFFRCGRELKDRVNG
jgi:integration host factor subunit beta